MAPPCSNSLSSAARSTRHVSMSASTCTDAVAALAHLAVADPYTALGASSPPPAGPSPLSAQTAASATKPHLTGKQPSSSVQLSAHQSTASALHLLQQLLTSPSSSSTSSCDEVNSRATSVGQAKCVQVNSQCAIPQPAHATIDTVSWPGKLSKLQARGFKAAAAADAGSATAAGALQDVTSDWVIIEDFCSRTVPRSWLKRLMHAWHAVARSLTKWRCIQQELLLRRCLAALLSWHRIAALECKRTSLLASHLWQEHQLRSVRLIFKAWRDVAAVATAQSSFVMQLLSVEDRAMLRSCLRAWRARCRTKRSVSSWRVIDRMQSLRQAMTAWQQWRLFKRYQATAATTFHRKQLLMRVLHCWRSEWLFGARAKQQVAKQHKYKVQLLQGRWRLQLLHSILVSWLDIAAAQAASQAHLSHTLQHVHMQLLVRAWFLVTQERIRLKGAALSAWREYVHRQQLKPRMLSAALESRKHRLWQQALRAWVGHWYRAASGKLIAARHCQRLMATTVHALSQHARQQKAKYVAWRAAGQHWRRSVFRAFCRGCALSQQQQCMQDLALMFHWASTARCYLCCWQAYTHQQLAKKQRWELAARHHCLWSQGTLFATWAEWFVWQQRKRLSRALGRRASLRKCLTKWQKRLLHTAAVADAFRSVQVKQLALVSLQRWYQLVLYKREVYPQMLSRCLRAWAAYVHRLLLLRFLLLEQMAIRQARQKAAVLAAWRDMTASCTAEARQCGQHGAVDITKVDSSDGAQDLAGGVEWVMQLAFQGWRAVVLHMAAHREQLQQLALASAKRAIQKGCHAAAQFTVASNNTAVVQFSLLEQQDGHVKQQAGEQLRLTAGSVQMHAPMASVVAVGAALRQVEQQALREQRVEHADLVGPVQVGAPMASVTKVAVAPHQGAVELTAAFFKASAHWSEKVKARVLHAWQGLSRQAIASVWQQHELKALANEQLLELVQHQQQADGHRRHHLLACVFYPWLECSLRSLHTQKVCQQPERQYPNNAAPRSPDVLGSTSDAAMQACTRHLPMSRWDQTPPEIVALDAVANPAGLLHGHSNCGVQHDPVRHYAGSTSHCSTAPLLEISANTNHSASLLVQRVCHASDTGKAGTQLTSEVGLGAVLRRQSTNSCRNGNNGAMQIRSGTGRDSNVVFGSSNTISSSSSNRLTGQQWPASNQPKDLASTQGLRQLQGGRNRNMAQPKAVPRHDHHCDMDHDMCQQSRCSGSESDSHRKQAAIAAQDARGQKASSSTANRRKALMKAIVRTMPTRAPSLLSESSQLSCFSTATKLDGTAQCHYIERVHSQSSSGSGAMSFQSQQPLTGQLHSVGSPAISCPALSALEAGSRSNALADLSIAESCTFPDCQSAMGQPMSKEVGGIILESAERRTVKRSLLSQPDFH